MKLFKRLLSSAVMVTILVSLVSVTPALAAGENLLGSRNCGFETAGETTTGAEGWNGNALRTEGTAELPAHSGSFYMAFTNGASTYTTTVAVVPETNYTMGMWVRSSAINSGYIDLRYLVNGQYFNLAFPKYITGEHLYTEYFGVTKPAPATGETDTRAGWDYVTFNFTTPRMANGVNMSITQKAADSFFAIDDITFYETGYAPNLLNNGYLLGVKAPNVPSWWSVTGTPETHYKITDDGAGTNIYSLLAGNSYLRNTGVPLLPGRYRLEMDFKSNTTSYGLGCYFKLGTVPSGWTDGRMNITGLFSAGKWQSVRMYFDIPVNAASDGYLLGDFRIEPGWVANVKNMRLWLDKTSTEYTTRSASSNTFTSTRKGSVTVIDSPLSSISSAVKDGGVYTVYANTHYIPATDTAESFDVVNCVYRKYANGLLVLDKAVVSNGTTAADGRAKDVSTPVTVNELAGDEGYTYVIKTYVFNSLQDLEPFGEACTLNY